MGADRSLIVIGAGPMGLAAAYYAAKAGWSVRVLEAASQPGGMAMHFDFDGLSLEKFYHFCCKSDVDTQALLAELGLPPIRWKRTKMGFFVDGHLYPWGGALALLRFPLMSMTEKFRYALMAFTSIYRSDWSRLDKISAVDWVRRWCGDRLYEKFWRPLFELKFHEYCGQVPAAWVWQRIKRLGRSRTNMQEELGYIEGGSERLITGLIEGLEALGGRVSLSSPADRLLFDGETIAGVQTADGERHLASRVISTVPLPYLPALLADRPALAARYEGFDNIGVVCVIHKLRRSLSPNFWINISDDRFAIPGVVEFSNLRPLEDTIIYVPYYMPVANSRFARSDQAFIDESFTYLTHLSPGLTAADRIASHVGRLKYAQPVYGLDFADKIPSPQTSVAGLQIADTTFYYPEDRGVSESIRYAKAMVGRLDRV